MPIYLGNQELKVSGISSVYVGNQRVWRNVIPIAIPTLSGSYTYTGSTITPSWNDYDATQITIGGTYSSVNAGTFTATFTPNQGYCWTDMTTETKSVSWSIARATGTISLNKYSVTLQNIGGASSSTVVVTTNSDGAISASSSDTLVVTTSVSGKNVTAQIGNNGTGTVAVTVSIPTTSNVTGVSTSFIVYSTNYKLIGGQIAYDTVRNNSGPKYTFYNASRNKITYPASDDYLWAWSVVNLLNSATYYTVEGAVTTPRFLVCNTSLDYGYTTGKSYSGAASYASSANSAWSGGYNDWRVPTTTDFMQLYGGGTQTFADYSSRKFVTSESSGSYCTVIWADSSVHATVTKTSWTQPATDYDEEYSKTGSYHCFLVRSF